MPAAARGGLFKSSVSIHRVGSLIYGAKALRNEDGRSSGASLLYGVRNGGENGEAKVCLASLLGIRSSNDLGS